MFLKIIFIPLLQKIMIYPICNLSKFFTEEDFCCGSGWGTSLFFCSFVHGQNNAYIFNS